MVAQFGENVTCLHEKKARSRHGAQNLAAGIFIGGGRPKQPLPGASVCLALVLLCLLSNAPAAFREILSLSHQTSQGMKSQRACDQCYNIKERCVVGPALRSCARCTRLGHVGRPWQATQPRAHIARVHGLVITETRPLVTRTMSGARRHSCYLCLGNGFPPYLWGCLPQNLRSVDKHNISSRSVYVSSEPESGKLLMVENERKQDSAIA